MTVLVRHAESEWNRAFGTYRIDAGITDPGLTPTGVGQARELADRLLGSGIGRIVASPYRRTLQTAAIVAEALEVPVEVEPLVRERCAFSCDQGSAPEELAREWPDLDLGGLGPCWWGGAIESVESLGARCALFRERLRRRPDRDTLLVVSHWGFIRGLTGLEVKNAALVRLRRRPRRPFAWRSLRMTDAITPNGGAEGQDQQSGPRLSILTQYVKDMSFENPRAPFGLQPARRGPRSRSRSTSTRSRSATASTRSCSS